MTSKCAAGGRYGAILLVLSGCAGSVRVVEPAPAVDVRAGLVIFRGDDGALVGWEEIMDAVAGADVIVLGEEHDDAVGHGFQLAVVEDVLQRWPDSAVSMEMFDRTEQAVVDDYLADFIDLETFQERTASTRWLKLSRQYAAGELDRTTFEQRMARLGWPEWETNYQPIVDTAKAAGVPVIAANTPWLVYMSVARRDGFGRLDDVTTAQRALFEVPDRIPDGAYRQRFWEVLAGRAEGEPAADVDVDDDDEGAHPGFDDETILGMFRGQLVMDATMAASIAETRRAGAEKVVHLVGHFHCDFEGGLVQELRYRDPDARILVITVLAEAETELRDEDSGRADFVVYTGR